MTLDRRTFLTRCAQCAAGLLLGGSLWRAHAQSTSLPIVPEVVNDPLGLGLEQWTRTTCDLCGLGEPVFIGTRGGVPAAVKGIPRSTVGFGRLCVRARALVESAASEDRATTPLIRRDPKTKGTLEGLELAAWDEALAAAAGGLGAARERLGRDGIGFLASDGETNETYGLLARLVRAGLGSDHLDTLARLDALHAAEACRDVFGVSANPSCFADVDAASLIVMIGGDLAESHPSLFYRVLDARRTGRARIVLIDARKTEAAALADLHLRARPGHELAVVNALALALFERGAIETTERAAAASWRAWLAGHTEGERPRAHAPLGTPTSQRVRYSLLAALAAAGILRDQVAALETEWSDARGVVTLVGPTALGAPSGAALARAIAQLHRMTGMWGRAGRGVLFMARGANTTGAQVFGIAPGWLPAGGRLEHAADRARLAAAYGIDAAQLPARAGWPALEWPAAIAAGRMGAIVALRANPAAEMPDALGWRAALERAFVVAATTHAPTETTAYADVVLPLAVVSGETAGTTMTLDRRCHLLDAGCTPPGDARAGGEIVAALGRALLPAERHAALVGAGEWNVYAEWDRWRAMSKGTAFDASGIGAHRLREVLDLAWPCGALDHPGSARLDPAAAPAARYQATAPAVSETRSGTLVLVTGPLREHARSRVVTGKTPSLHYEAPSPQLEMHPHDGVAAGLANGDWVVVESSTGAAVMRLWLTERAQPGMVYAPEHFGFVSDLQGGSLAQKEPEGLAHRITSTRLVGAGGAPAGMMPAVSVRAAKRRDLRQRGI